MPMKRKTKIASISGVNRKPSRNWKVMKAIENRQIDFFPVHTGATDINFLSCKFSICMYPFDDLCLLLSTACWEKTMLRQVIVERWFHRVIITISRRALESAIHGELMSITFTFGTEDLRNSKDNFRTRCMIFVIPIGSCQGSEYFLPSCLLNPNAKKACLYLYHARLTH